MSKRLPIIDFDNNWKEAIEKHTYEAVRFFMPDLYRQIDTTRIPVFLEQEMRNLRRGTQKGRKKIMDKLIKVWLKTGEERWILIHIEVESSDKDGFNKRMYIYYSRAFDKYDVAIVALALFVGEKLPPSHDIFEQKYCGTELTYRYNVYIVSEQDEQSLLDSDNIFALFILANLYTIQTKNDMKRRLLLKKKIHELGIERKIPLETLNSFLTFVFEIMPLPLTEAKKYDNFRLKKQKEMTDAAFKKRRAKTHKNFADVYTKAAYDMYPSEMLKALKQKDEALNEALKKKDEVLKEKDEVLKEKDEVLKEKDEVLKETNEVLKETSEVLKEKDETLQRLIVYLHFNEDKMPDAIAAITAMPLSLIETILLSHRRYTDK
jgi:hypothetical protein